MSARIGSAWKKFRELSGLLVGKQGLSLKQWGKIYQCCVRLVLLACFEMWKLIVEDEGKLCVVEHHMIRIIHGVRLVDRLLTDVLQVRMGAVVKIKDMIIQSCLWWYGQVICGDINFQIYEVMELENEEGSTKEII